MLMKKYISIILVAVMFVFCLSGCDNDTTKKVVDKPIKIVTTIFPEYDWVKEILGDNADNVELTMLLDNGVDLHSYQPTADDILKISNCDLFIYVGGESDEWVEDVLKEADNKKMRVINLLDILGDSVKEEVVVEGMEDEHDHEHDHEHEPDSEPEHDEHVWLSLKNTQIICNKIADTLAEVDPEHREKYQNNVTAYNKKLETLDAEYQQTVNSAKQKTLVFGDRFPFRYLVDDYGLSYYAAFVGCSAETEASFETVTFLAGKVDELGLENVLTIEKSDKKIARTIIENTRDKKQKIMTLDSMQSIVSKDIAEGASYLSIMEKNLDVLKEALN